MGSASYALTAETSASKGLSLRTAVAVMRLDRGLALCPFFGKCEGVLVIDHGTGAREFHASEGRSPEAMCDAILKSGASRLILGFVAQPEARKLRAAGIDIRIGSCACTLEELVESFDDLSAAWAKERVDP